MKHLYKWISRETQSRAAMATSIPQAAATSPCEDFYLLSMSEHSRSDLPSLCAMSVPLPSPPTLPLLSLGGRIRTSTRILRCWAHGEDLQMFLRAHLQQCTPVASKHTGLRLGPEEISTV